MPASARPIGPVLDLGGCMRLVAGRSGWFVVNTNDVYIGQSIIRYGEYCWHEFELLQQVCKAGDIIVEVGANIGTHTVGLAAKVGPGGRVIAYEPQPAIFQLLCANVALNGLLNVDCRSVGLGDAAKAIEIPRCDYTRPGNFGGISLERAQAGGMPVEIRTLDESFGAERVNLLKIDAEGMEIPVLRGAANVIRRFKPVIYVENDRVERSRELIELLQGLGYRLWWHLPPLFNAKNHFGNPENVFRNLVSVNMLGLHEMSRVTVSGLKPIQDTSEHPMAERRRTVRTAVRYPAPSSAV